jgi:hypothetical protein
MLESSLNPIGVCKFKEIPLQAFVQAGAFGQNLPFSLLFFPQLIFSFSFCRSACDQRHLERKNLRGHTFGFNQTR